MSYSLHAIPLIRVLIPLILGIITALRLEAPRPLPWIIPALLLFCLVMYLLFPDRLINWTKRWIIGLVISLLYIWAGFDLVVYRRAPPAHPPQKEVIWVVVLDSDPVEGISSVRAEAKIIGYIEKGLFFEAKGGVLLYFKQDEGSLPEYGEVLVCKGDCRMIQDPANPYGFDRKAFYAGKGITHQLRLEQQCWRGTNGNEGNPLIRKALKIRKALLSRMKDEGMAGREYQVASALLLGEQRNQDPEIRQAYAGAGVTHILSVSGLHVGLVYLLFHQAFFFLNRGKWSKRLKSLILILLIWGYALLTGLSPPVVRSAAMLSIIIIARALRRKTQLMNVLASSALLMLLINPFLLRDIGFQLSYLAVAGIVTFQKPLSERWAPAHPWADKIWKLAVVTCVAQASTAPLAIHYFHQFPLYFLPANLIIIPYSSLIMYFGVLCFGFVYIPHIASFSVTVLSYIIKGMNLSIEWFSQLPGAVAGNLCLNEHAVILIYITLFFLMASVEKNFIKNLWISILALCSFGINQFISQESAQGMNQIIIMNERGKAIFTHLKNRELQFLLPVDTALSQVKESYLITNLLNNNSLSKATSLSQASVKSIDSREWDLLLLNRWKGDVFPGKPKSSGIVVWGPKLGKEKSIKLRKLCKQMNIKHIELSSLGTFVFNLKRNTDLFLSLPSKDHEYGDCLVVTFTDGRKPGGMDPPPDRKQ